MEGMTVSNETRLRDLELSLAGVIKGKPEVLRLSLVCLLSKGHLLIEDVPGVGKTTLAHALARSVACRFQRLQFTSDMLPGDVLGVTIYNQQNGEFEFKPGPDTRSATASETGRAAIPAADRCHDAPPDSASRSP